MKVKGKNCYDLNCIDNVTKYVTAHLFVEKRTLVKCKEFLQQIKTACYDQILERYRKEKNHTVKKRKLVIFVCDGFANYKTAFNTLFYRVAKLVSSVPIACRKHGLKHNNNTVERYNGSLKDRIKTMRGGFGSFECAEDFMNLKRVLHNFVNPHQKLKGKTPVEAANVKLPLGRNKLLSLIKYVKRHRITKT